MSDPARAFWCTGPFQGEIRAQPLGPLGPDMVRVRTHYSAISRGTESLVWRGGVPDSQRQAMRAPFQEGAFPFPVKYGYSAVGVVEAGPDELVGRRVFCLHPHQDLFDVPADAVNPLPDDLPAERATLAANMETAVNGCWDAQPLAGERIAVIGAGVVGCLVARLLAQIPGATVELIDVDPAKRRIAEALGVAFRGPDEAARDCDLIVHVSGAPSGLATALELAGVEARIVEMSWYGDQTVSLPLGEAFHSRRLALISSQVGRLPAHRRARWDYGRRMAVALDLLRDPVFDALLSRRSTFEELPARMREIAETPGVLCWRLAYPGVGAG
ncbi:MAG: zinc-binding alcohol dehydrogenase [Marivibrio sp.]|uniref:zinc-dependent alcohol dehydrogenase n=1 Tax=Marivibrio sp. TaxID=2039719 RepID=UPI0032EDFE7A